MFKGSRWGVSSNFLSWNFPAKRNILDVGVRNHLPKRSPPPADPCIVAFLYFLTCQATFPGDASRPERAFALSKHNGWLFFFIHSFLHLFVYRVPGGIFGWGGWAPLLSFPAAQTTLPHRWQARHAQRLTLLDRLEAARQPEVFYLTKKVDDWGAIQYSTGGGGRAE